ncbi:MAG: hypothetical protein AVDCRST_MAG33-3292 [uncultured Thermomicrobiales bacterium]|uniref:Esterase n=1 Tax=uncultured Thermomicrobiales bacterium TaxID=1645740 RepID=A0A6J4VMZ2_9BACT|nr:MAG: hypothetical protein AVDCRST_MAG33-3292 [uncultured Thermomicrobiales bacterium]
MVDASPLPVFPIASGDRSPPMTIASVTFHSAAMGRNVSYQAIIPPGEGPPPPVVLQLHGSGDDHQSWLVNSRIAHYARAYRLLVVMPDGGSSGYLNYRSHDRRGRQRYEDLLMDDLPGNVAATFRVAVGPWGIGGLSMGGFGAMRLGLKYPERFASIWAHSGSFAEMPGLEEFVDGDDATVETVAIRLAGRPEQPVVSFDCGSEDSLLDANRAFHALLDRLGIAHRYLEHPGAHDWDYWDRHVGTALGQHDRVLNGSGSPRATTGPSPS